MEHRVFNNPKNSKLIENLDNAIYSLKYISKDESIGESVRELSKMLEERKNNLETFNKELIKFLFEESKFRYWKIIINDKDRFYVYPYYCRTDNGIVFAVGYDIENLDYCAGLKDMGFELYGDGLLLKSEKVEFIEVSEEDFRNVVKNNALRPLDSRLWKLKNRDHLI